MEEKFGRLLFIVAFCQFHTSMCNLLALNQSLTLLLSAMKKPRLLCSILLYQIQRRKKKMHFVYWVTRNTSYLVWSPCCPCSHTCPWACRGSACECFITMGLHTERVLFCSVPRLVDTAGDESLILPPRPQASSYRFTGKKALRKDGRKSLWQILHFRQTTMRAYVLFVFLRARPRSFRKMKRKESSPSEKVFPVQFFVSSG